MCQEQCNKLMSDDISKIASALAKAQLIIEHPKKNRTNPFYGSTYADLMAIIDAIKGPFAKNELSHVQLAESENEMVKITTILLHSSGQWIKGVLYLKPTKNDPQGCGSAITYGRRYGLQAIAGISADEDDDGNQASVSNNKPKQNKKPEKKQDKTPWMQMCDALKEKNITNQGITDIANFIKAGEDGILSDETMLDVAKRPDAYINEWKEASDIPL